MVFSCTTLHILSENLCDNIIACSLTFVQSLIFQLAGDRQQSAHGIVSLTINEPERRSIRVERKIFQRFVAS